MTDLVAALTDGFAAQGDAMRTLRHELPLVRVNSDFAANATSGTWYVQETRIGAWRVRKITGNSTAIADVSNNAGVTQEDAWTNRTTLTYRVA